MAKRNIRVWFRVSPEEFIRLTTNVAKTGLSREAYLRSLVMGKVPKERPSMDVVSVLKNLQQINNNLNQIAVKANKMNFIDTSAYWTNVDYLEEVIGELLEVMYK